MKLDAVAYDTIVILRASGSVGLPEAKTFADELQSECGDFAKVILDLSAVELRPDGAAALLETRKERLKKKPRLYLAHPSLAGVDAHDLPGALVAIGTAETDLILDLFEKGHDVAELRAELETLRAQACGLLGLPPDSPAPKFESAAARFQEESRKGAYLLKTLAAEIDALKGTGAASDVSSDARAKVDAARNAAGELLRKGNIVS